MKTEIVNTPGGTVFSGRPAVDLYRATVIKHGIALYAKTGMKPNRAYTPTAMLAAAGQITGKTYKRGQFAQAIADLEIHIEAQRATIPVRHD